MSRQQAEQTATDKSRVQDPHDGMYWRLIVQDQDDHLHLSIEHEHAGEWLTTQRWTEPVPRPRERRERITESAEAHGWVTPAGRWPRVRKDGKQVITGLTLMRWDRVLRDATAFREQQLAAAGAADKAWRLAIITARDLDGYNVSELAALVGRGRHAIYRMNEDDLDMTELKILAEARSIRKGES